MQASDGSRDFSPVNKKKKIVTKIHATSCLTIFASYNTIFCEFGHRKTYALYLINWNQRQQVQIYFVHLRCKRSISTFLCFAKKKLIYEITFSVMVCPIYQMVCWNINIICVKVNGAWYKKGANCFYLFKQYVAKHIHKLLERFNMFSVAYNKKYISFIKK